MAGNNSGSKAPAGTSAENGGRALAPGAVSGGRILGDTAGALKGAPVGRQTAGVMHTERVEPPSTAHHRTTLSKIVEEWRKQAAAGADASAQAPASASRGL